MPPDLEYLHCSKQDWWKCWEKNFIKFGSKQYLLIHATKTMVKTQISAEIGLYRHPGPFEAGVYGSQVLPWAPSSASFFLSASFFPTTDWGYPVARNRSPVAPEFYVWKLCRPRWGWVSTIPSPSLKKSSRRFLL